MLNDWQLEDATKIARWGGGIIGHEMGVGKTAIAIEAHRQLHSTDEPKPTLVIAPLIALSVWEAELEIWAPELVYVVLQGSKAQRLKQRDLIDEPPLDLVLTTYDVIVRDADYFRKQKYDIMICDEAHRLKNKKTKRFKTIKSLRRNHSIMVTGTPIRAAPQDLWALLALVNSTVFSSYWRFVDTFCEIIDGDYGREIVGPRNSAALRNLLDSRYMVRRTKKQVLPYLPDKIRQVIRIRMVAEQTRLYQSLVNEALIELRDGGWLLVPSQLACITRLRQLLVCPKILDPDSNCYGAGLEAIWQMWEDSPQDYGVIFTSYPSVGPFAKEFFASKGESRFDILRGGTKAVDVTQKVRQFEERGGLLLVSIRFAESYSLSFCPRCWFLGCEWTPADNNQAEDRLHRRTSTNSVNSYFLRHTQTVEEEVAMTLYEKTKNFRSIVRDFDSAQRMLYGNIKN